MRRQPSASPGRMWTLARLAAEHGWFVDVVRAGSSYRLILTRGTTEAVVRWRARDRHVQGDGAGGWRVCGRAGIARDAGRDRTTWVGLKALRLLLIEHGRPFLIDGGPGDA